MWAADVITRPPQRPIQSSLAPVHKDDCHDKCKLDFGLVIVSASAAIVHK
jgi:hypothetical protein